MRDESWKGDRSGAAPVPLAAGEEPPIAPIAAPRRGPSIAESSISPPPLGGREHCRRHLRFARRRPTVRVTGRCGGEPGAETRLGSRSLPLESQSRCRRRERRSRSRVRRTMFRARFVRVRSSPRTSPRCPPRGRPRSSVPRCWRRRAIRRMTQWDEAWLKTSWDATAEGSRFFRS